MKIKNRFLYVAAGLLLFSYLLSFTNLFKGSNKKSYKTALLNPKYKEAVTSIQIKHLDEQILLEKKSDFWIVKTGNNEFSLPAEKKHIENLLNTFTNITNMYKLSDKMSKNNDIRFENSSVFYLRCSFNDSYSDYILGSQDFSRNFRYLMTGKSTSVYQIGMELEAFLSTSLHYWAEPEILSSQVEKNLSPSDIQRLVISDLTEEKTRILTPNDKNFLPYVTELLGLRHGGIYSSEENSSPSHVLKIKVELGNKNEVQVTARKINDSSYRLSVFYKNQNYTSDMEISQWTFLKLNQK